MIIFGSILGAFDTLERKGLFAGEDATNGLRSQFVVEKEGKLTYSIGEQFSIHPIFHHNH